MKYEITKWFVEGVHPSNIEIILEGEDPKEVFLAIARHSYNTAKPRHMDPLSQRLIVTPSDSYEGAQLREEAKKRRHIHSIDELPDFEQYFENDVYGQKMLVMDYINDRDCRTVAKLLKGGRMWFNAYAFEQRGVSNLTRFLKGERAIHATEFLDEVIDLMKGDDPNTQPHPITKTLKLVCENE